jgi:hypothetical protein
MLEITQKMLFSIILFLIILVIMSSFASSPNCDSMADESTKALRDAVNAVAAPDFPEWRGDLPPSSDDTRYYKPVLVKVCENNPGNMVGPIVVSATWPSYTIFYEEFPQKPLAIWDDTYPWSGGTTAALTNYFIISYGLHVAPGAYKALKGTVKFGKKAVSIGFRDALKEANVIERIKNWAQFWRTGKDATMRAIEEQGILRYAFEKNKQSILKASKGTEFEKVIEKEQEPTFQAFEEGGIITWDSKLGKYVATKDGRKILSMMRESLSDEAKKIFDDQFFIPSRWNWATNVKIRVNNEKAKLISAKTRFYNKLSEPAREAIYSFQKKLGREAMLYTSTDVQLMMKDVSRYCKKKPAECMKEFEEFLQEPENQKTVQQVLGRSVVKDGKIAFSTKDMLEFMEKAPKSISQEELQGGTMVIVSLNKKGAPAVKSVIKQNLDDLSSEEKGRFYEILRSNTITENDKALLSKVFAGTDINDFQSQKVILEKYSEKLSEQLQDVWTKSSLGLLPAGETSASYALSLTADRISEPELSKTVGTGVGDVMGVYFPKTIDPGKLPAGANPKYWFYIRLNRLYPTTLLANPTTPWIPSSKYVTDLSADQASDSCSAGSLCLLTPGGVKNYPLNDNAQRYDVRLWRPKPAVTQRLPIFLQTGWFYATVDENPKFYTVGPCLAKYHVWKKGGTIYISTEYNSKTGEKTTCSVLDENGNPKSAPNYCYADFNYVWGSSFNGQEEQALIMDGVPWIILAKDIGVCAAATAASAGAVQFQSCLKLGLFTDIYVTYLPSASLAAYNKDPDWGYWSYYKTADAIDIFQTAEMFTGDMSSIAPRLAKVVRYATILAGPFADPSMDVIMAGENALAWPGRVKGVLTDQDIFRSQGQCLMRP